MFGPNPQPAVGFKQAYLYDYAGQNLVCASCVAEVTPTADVKIEGGNTGGLPFLGDQHVGLGRSASNNGQMFFDTVDSLLPRDTNGKRDVYEYDVGRGLRLISTGQSDSDSLLGDSSEDGSTVDFMTRESLVGQDGDVLRDLDVARIGGNAAAQSPPPPQACQGDACQGQFTSPPPGPGPGTSVFEGPPNATKSLNCRKKFVRRNGRCVKKKHKKKHKKAHRRHTHRSHKSRRASR